MAKFYKFTGYLLDINNEFDGFQSYLNYINQRRSGYDVEATNVQCVEIEWGDDIDLNQMGCTVEQMDSYFSKELIP